MDIRESESGALDPNSEHGDSGLSRREALKKGAIAGGAIMWATPVIQSVGLSGALAQQPSPRPPQCQCIASACALRITGLVNVTACGNPQCVAEVFLGTARIATVLCATAETTPGANAACDASASVATLDIPPIAVTGTIGINIPRIQATVLTSSVSAPCNCAAPTVTSNVATLTIGGNNVTVPPPGGTTTVQTPAGTLLIAVGERTCVNGVTTVRALRISLGTLLDVVVAESAAGAVGCPCPTP